MASGIIEHEGIVSRVEGDRVYVKISDKAGYYVVVKRLENTKDDGSDQLRSY